MNAPSLNRIPWRRPGAAGAVLLLMLLGGCASTGEPPPLLDEARSEYEAARDNPRIRDFAARNMDAAERHLRQAREAFEEGEEPDLVEHHAFLAQQHVAIAAARLRRGLTQEEIGRADQNRQALLLEVERRSAAQASQRAALAEAELVATRAELEDTRQRAQELSEKIAELEVSESERGTVFTLSDVVFDFDSAQLNEGGQRSVARIAEIIKEYPEGQILIEGFTDSVGQEGYNEDLSRRRATAVREAFVSHGIPAGRIQVEGYGEAYPVASNDTAEGRQLNRRVEIVVASEGQPLSRRGS